MPRTAPQEKPDTGPDGSYGDGTSCEIFAEDVKRTCEEPAEACVVLQAPDRGTCGCEHEVTSSVCRDHLRMAKSGGLFCQQCREHFVVVEIF